MRAGGLMSVYPIKHLHRKDKGSYLVVNIIFEEAGANIELHGSALQQTNSLSWKNFMTLCCSLGKCEETTSLVGSLYILALQLRHSIWRYLGLRGPL
jgi:hypothetical protein